MADLVGMSEERWKSIEADYDAKLEAEEISIGWHFCPEWDGMLVGPGMDEFEHWCTCGLGGNYDADEGAT